VWLNNGQRELQKLILQAGQNFYVKRIYTTLVVNQNDYVLPEDFLKNHRLEIVQSGTTPNETVTPVTPITINQVDLINTTTGTPACYYLKKNRITLEPAPDTALVMRMFYSYRVSDMTLATDMADAPEEFHEFIAVLATLDGLLKDQRDPGPMLEKRRYYEAMLKNEAQERTQDGPRGIVETGSYTTGGWYY
jgi:hypothetical protein